MGQPLRVGIVGAGTIATHYVDTITRLDALELVAVADLDASRAEQLAQRSPNVRASAVPQLVAADDVDVVLNLTIPAAHADVAHQVVDGGKHVYGEKPLAAGTAEARAVLDAAESAGVLAGCAPDTVLGTGTQTARRAIDDGLIGAPIAATATMITPGHERWHPQPDFYYAPGGGPLYDMGPYYVTALVTLLGPVVSVLGAASRSRDTRTIGSGPRAGQPIPVDVDTHVTAILRHASGALSTLVMSFDGVATQAPRVEVHGEQASLVVPDPNGFAGDVLLRGLGSSDWTTLPPSAGYAGGSRGIGLLDLAAGQKALRASGDLGFHVLDVIESVIASAHADTALRLASTAPRPDSVPLTDL